MKTKLLLTLFLTGMLSFSQGTGEIIITEIHNRPQKPTAAQVSAATANNPGSAGNAAGEIGTDGFGNEAHTEWFEIYNTTASAVDMTGWKLTDASSSSNFTVMSAFTIPANSYAVFSGYNIPAAQGGIVFDYFYEYKKPSFNNESSYTTSTTNCPDGVIIEKPDGSGGYTLVDEVKYDYGYGSYIGGTASCGSLASSYGFPAQGGSSKVSFMLKVNPATMNAADNDLAANWEYSTLVYDATNNQIGTPGVANNDASLSSSNFDLDKSFVFYPNPAESILNFKTKVETQINAITFHTIEGKEVLNVKNLTNNTLDISSLSTGIYTVKINTQEGVLNKKIIVK